MSIRIMSAVWELDLPDSEKLILLALADNANDAGVCWPSMATLARKCSKGERTVQGAIQRLQKAGYLKRDEKPGKGVTYTVTPAAAAPPQEPHPRREVGDTPAAAAPKPSKNRHSSEAKASSLRIARPDDVSEQTWGDFKQMRDKQRAPPTATALAAIRREAGKVGWSMEQALAECCARSWRGFKAEWVKEDRNGHRNGQHQVSTSGYGRTIDAALDFVREAEQCRSG